MNTVSLERMTQLYGIQGQPRLQSLRVHYEPFKQFSIRLQKLLLRIKFTNDLEVLIPSLRILRRYRFDMCASPVSFGSPAIISIETLERLDWFAERYRTVHPRHHVEFLDIVQTLKMLVKSDQNPMFLEILKNVSQGEEVAILLKEPRHIRFLEQFLNSKGLEHRINVVSWYQLRRSGDSFEKLFCVGTTSWFPEFVLRAPRAKITYVTSYSWLSSRIQEPKPVFEGWEKIRHFFSPRPSSITVLPSPSSNTKHHETAVEEISPNDVIPQIDLTDVMTKARHPETDPSDPLSLVMSRLCRLEDGLGVFIEDRDGATSLVIDLEEEDRRKVRRVCATDIRQGMFLIQRSDEADDADYIVPLANSILGARAVPLRKFQSTWKDRLRRVVVRYDATHIINSLKRHGSVKANEPNLSNWMSERSIRTEDPRDFNAIMNLIGLSGDATACWGFASEILRAHRRAGRLVRRQLIRLVNETDLIELERLGKMKFELEEIGARPLLAVRIIEVSNGNISVPATRINRMFELPEVLSFD